jgi:hypothetical protein
MAWGSRSSLVHVPMRSLVEEDGVYHQDRRLSRSHLRQRPNAANFRGTTHEPAKTPEEAEEAYLLSSPSSPLVATESFVQRLVAAIC